MVLRPHPRPLSRRAKESFDRLRTNGVVLRPHPRPLSRRARGEPNDPRVAGDGIATWFDRLTMSGCAPRNDKVVVGLCPHTSRRRRNPEPYAAVGVVLVVGDGRQQLLPGGGHFR